MHNFNEDIKVYWKKKKITPLHYFQIFYRTCEKGRISLRNFTPD